MGEIPSAGSTRTEALVRDLVAEVVEQPWLEFKVNNTDPQLIGRTFSAIANGAALVGKAVGHVVWGVEDTLHAVVGTTFEPDQVRVGNQPLSIWLTQKLEPCPALRFITAEVDGRRVVVAEVPAASRTPVRYDGQSYIRIGSSTTRIADHVEVERRLWSKLQAFAWETVAAAEFLTAADVLSMLDYRAFGERLELPPSEDPQVNLERLASDRLIEPDVGSRWKILNLGAILIASDLASFPQLQRKAVRVIQYAGKDKLDTIRRLDHSRGYATGFEDLIRSINSILPKNEYIGEAFREERPMYPPIAIREIVANALIHQDMTVTGAGPLIEMFSDRVEITNPGAPLIEPSRMIDFPPRSRNEALASIMRRMRICEEQGTGVDKVIRAVELFQLPPPNFKTVGDNMSVSVYEHRSFSEMDAEERTRAAYQHAVLRYLVGQRLTNASLRERLGIAEHNAAQVTRIINDARDANLIKLADPAAPRAGYLPAWA
jgi:ATP-dependent DNA helicase RecG